MSKTAALFLSFAAATILCAQQHPDFSGNWSLNAAASDYGAKSASKPDRLTLNIQQKGDALKYHFERQKDGKKGAFDVDLKIGGREYESDAAGVVTAAWKGDKLEVNTLYNPGQDRQSDQVETWSLAAGGKQMIDEVKIHPPHNAAEVIVRRVLDKTN